jgi:hypothetical protein
MAERETELPAKSRRRDPYSGQIVLRTESKDDYDAALAQIWQYIEPKDLIEEMYVREEAHYTWQLMRARRIETNILNNALQTALGRVLAQILYPPIDHSGSILYQDARTEQLQQQEFQSKKLAYEWLSDPDAKRRVSDLLVEAGFDGSAIEAEAFCLVEDDLENARRMVKSAEDGRDKALRKLAKHRKTFANQLRGASDRVLADQVPSIAGAVN